jgi:peptidoglycan LD-endopeptidase LytH
MMLHLLRWRAAPARVRFVRFLGLLVLLGAAGVTNLEAQVPRQGLVSRLLEPMEFPYLAHLGRLIIPVEGIEARHLRDSYHEGRAGGRVHRAIDIHARRGTPVLAVADGTILKLYTEGKGGNSIYHLDRDGRTRYYYAHLERFAPNLRDGAEVKKGDVIGFVGDTGNARRGDYHLHFSIALLTDRRRWWVGENLNPYPLLKETASVRRE